MIAYTFWGCNSGTRITHESHEHGPLRTIVIPHYILLQLCSFKRAFTIFFYKEYLLWSFVKRDHTPLNWTYFVEPPTCLTIYKICSYSSIHSKVLSQSSKQSIPNAKKIHSMYCRSCLSKCIDMHRKIKPRTY